MRRQSEFLDLLFKYGCIRTQKKQKVFYWCVIEEMSRRTRLTWGVGSPSRTIDSFSMRLNGI